MQKELVNMEQETKRLVKGSRWNEMRREATQKKYTIVLEPEVNGLMTKMLRNEKQKQLYVTEIMPLWKEQSVSAPEEVLDYINLAFVIQSGRYSVILNQSCRINTYLYAIHGAQNPPVNFTYFVHIQKSLSFLMCLCVLADLMVML